MTVPYSDFSVAVAVRPASRVYVRLGKRLLDVVLVVLAMPVVLPVLALIILAASAGGGKPLYVQRRIGRGGQPFDCWKIRTMVHDADKRLAQLMDEDEDLAREWRQNQKLAADPRITRFGRFLRRSSLDELPQLWNVLNGTMSLVGPRPFTPDQRALYASGRRDARYYDLLPGISGLWQVSRRNAGSFAERVHFDEAYGRQIGLRTDIAILWRTFAVVLRATGL